MEDESQPEEELSFDSPAMEDESQPEEELSFDEFSVSESETFDFNETEENLEAAEEKIDVLNKISDESFQEINDLLSSVQQDETEEDEELQSLFQNKLIDN